MGNTTGRATRDERLGGEDVSELVEYAGPGNPATELIEWAEAASAAHRLAMSLTKTRVCPDAFRNKPEEAAAVILLGAELGLSPIASLRAMYPAPGGQVGMYAKAMAALVVARGHVMWTEYESDERVTVCGHRAGQGEHVERAEWTIARARQAGFIRRGSQGQPSQYETQPRTMLWSRAVAELANKIAPDAIRGIPEADEPVTGEEARRVVVQRQPLPAREATGRPSGGSDAPGVGEPQAGPGDRPQGETVRAQATQGVMPEGVNRVNIPADSESPGQSAGADSNPDTEPPNEPSEPMIFGSQRARLMANLNALGIRDHDERVEWLSQALNRDVETSMDLTATEASYVLGLLDEARETRGGETS
jgi:hypothetical protein